VPPLTDTHCHLNLDAFQDDLLATILRAQQAGVARILVPGIDLATSQAAVALAEAHEPVFAAVGVHPTEVEQWDEHSAAQLADLAAHPKVKAIGEIGLDYYHHETAPAQQQAILLAQLALAAEMELPVVLHNREAFDDLWAVVQPWQTALAQAGSPLAARPGVFHAFDGHPDQARTVTQSNFFVGIGGPVTYKNAVERQEMATHLPMDRILIETDAPYLPPQPYRGRRNEPAYTKYIAEKIADLRGMEVAEITGPTAANAARLFLWEP
jgi:TatD DNase family protein